MLTVHHLNKSRSTRVIWLLEELELPFTVVKHQRNATTNLAPESLKKIHPLSKAPVIEEEGRLLCESGAIMEYILNKSPRNNLRPKVDADNYYAYLEWLHFAEGSLSLPLISKLLINDAPREGHLRFSRYIEKELTLDFNYIESRLQCQPYFAGNDFTAADIMMTFMLEIALKIGVLVTKPQTLKYLQTVQQRPAYQKAKDYG